MEGMFDAPPWVIAEFWKALTGLLLAATDRLRQQKPKAARKNRRRS